MKIKIITIFALISILVTFSYAFTTPGNSVQAAQNSIREISGGKAMLAVDEQAGTVAIIIDGKKVAVFDSSGLHVNGDLTYTGMTTDGNPDRLQKEADHDTL